MDGCQYEFRVRPPLCSAPNFDRVFIYSSCVYSPSSRLFFRIQLNRFSPYFFLLATTSHFALESPSFIHPPLFRILPVSLTPHHPTSLFFRLGVLLGRLLWRFLWGSVWKNHAALFMTLIDQHWRGPSPSRCSSILRLELLPSTTASQQFPSHLLDLFLYLFLFSVVVSQGNLTLLFRSLELAVFR